MKKPVWSRIRALFQIFFWLLFIILIINTRDPIENESLYNIVPKLSAYITLSNSIALRRVVDYFLPSVVIIIFTLILGRFFCGWICPLGSTIDVTDRLFQKEKKNTLTKKNDLKSYKYIILIISLILAIAGVNISGILDPLPLTYRSYSLAIYPYFDYITKSLFDILYVIPIINKVSEPIYSVLKISILDFNNIMFHNHYIIIFIFLGILILSKIFRRFWCQSLCPLGAVYALTARISFLKRTVNSNCVQCLACEKDCRMNAIISNGRETMQGECINCFECLKSCNYDAISFTFSIPFKRKGIQEERRAGKQGILTRKNFVMSFFSSLILIPFFKINTIYKEEHSQIIRPPGSLPEQRFKNTCIRCGECMKVCPNNALHPTLFESGLDGIFTPRLIPRLGYCEKNCNLCTITCPTKAIKTVSIPDKETTIIGTAYIIRDVCIPWVDKRNCLVCEEMCPTKTKAIRLEKNTIVDETGKTMSLYLPYVIEKLCIGCGICENKCPVAGSAAIKVRARKIVTP